MTGEASGSAEQRQGGGAPALVSLDEAECLRLISPGGVGRLAYVGRYGPTILPVNYKLHEDTIVFRTAQDSPTDEDLRTGIANAEYKVAFEIDELDPAARSGWSVLSQVSGFWQYRQRSGQPPVNTTNRVPGPSTPVDRSQE